MAWGILRRIPMTLSASTISIFDARDQLRAARTDFVSFVEHVMRDEEDAAIPIDDYTRIFADIAQKCWAVRRHINHVGTPGLGKSTLARALALHRLGQKPTMRQVIVGADKENAGDGVSLCREIVLTPNYQAVFPLAIADTDKTKDLRGWKTDRFFLRAAGQRKDPSMSARAATMKGEDIRVDLGLFDDLVTPGIIEQHGTLERVKRRFHKTWLEGRMANGGLAILIHNCQRIDDLAHSLRANRKFCSWWIGVTSDCERAFIRIWNPPPKLKLIETPAEFAAEPVEPRDGADYEFELPLPDRPSLKPAALRLMDTVTRNQLYHLVPATPDDLMIPSWPTRQVMRGRTVAQCLGLEEDGATNLPKMNTSDRMRIAVAAGVDVSSLKRKGCVVFFLALDPQGTIWPLAIFIGAFRMSDIADILDLMWNLGVEPSVINFENNGAQDQMDDALRTEGAKRKSDWRARMKSFLTGQNKSDPAAGLPSLETEIANRRFCFPDEAGRGLPHCANWLVWESAMANCPRFLEPGKSPDSLMAAWFARQGLRANPPIPQGVRSRAAAIRNETRDQF